MHTDGACCTGWKLATWEPEWVGRSLTDKQANPPAQRILACARRRGGAGRQRWEGRERATNASATVASGHDNIASCRRWHALWHPTHCMWLCICPCCSLGSCSRLQCAPTLTRCAAFQRMLCHLQTNALLCATFVALPRLLHDNSLFFAAFCSQL
jgi:hypothetical protein